MKAAPKVVKPLMSVPANHEVGGFMPMRQEFDTEHENEAETVISTLAYQDDDPEEERGLPLPILCILCVVCAVL